MSRIVVLVITCVLFLGILAGCGDSYTAQDLEDAKVRYFSGEASKEDKIMVEGFYEWKEGQD